MTPPQLWFWKAEMDSHLFLVYSILFLLALIFMEEPIMEHGGMSETKLDQANIYLRDN